jgi:exosortase
LKRIEDLTELDAGRLVPAIAAGLAFLVLFQTPISTLLRDWWNDPEAAHGLLLGPLAFWLAWKRGVRPGANPQALLGLGILVAAVLLRYASGLAAELFTMRISLLMALAGLTVFFWGIRQLLHWWLPGLLFLLSVPIPDVILGTLAFPMQLQASKMGASLLAWRHVPVQLAGNVIHLPGQTLFVAEACSGLRSLTALLALGILMGGLWLKLPAFRVLLVLVTLPVAMVINGFRVFLTGFLVFFVDPAVGRGFMHYTEGWVLFLVAFAILGMFTRLAIGAESYWLSRRNRVANGNGGPEMVEVTG